MQTSARGRPAINAGYHQAREGVFLNSLLEPDGFKKPYPSGELHYNKAYGGFRAENVCEAMTKVEAT